MMTNIKDKLTPYEQVFFDKLENYLDKPIYFYGSILRDDYFSQMSDIDIDIFTDNEHSTISMLHNFLNLPNNSFKKCVYRLDNATTTIIKGYKCKYIDEDKNLMVEISLYNEKHKQFILAEHQGKTAKIPFYISILLVIIKVLHYRFGLLPFDYYRSYKNTLMDKCFHNNKPDFIITDI